MEWWLGPLHKVPLLPVQYSCFTTYNTSSSWQSTVADGVVFNMSVSKVLVDSGLEKKCVHVITLISSFFCKADNLTSYLPA